MLRQQAQKIGQRLRRKRIEPLLAMVDDTFRRRGTVRILDLGGLADYWRIVPENFLETRSVTVTIVNLDHVTVTTDKPGFRFVTGDACALPDLADDSFDIVHSNSVIEHVGSWDRMVRFASEVRRLAPCYFVQTPYFWFPVEPHFVTPFFHWLPRPLRVSLIRRFALGHWQRHADVGEAVLAADSAVLLDRRMFRYLFPDADVRFERVFGVPKSMIAIRC